MLKTGDMIGERYQLGRLLGAGGFGAVYEATRLDLGQRVALKLLHPHVMGGHPEHAERFYREAQTIQRLHHPNTVRLFDFGHVDDEAGQHIYMTLECLDGRSLQDELERHGALSVERVARITAQVLRSLGEAHNHGIIHRDIKPSNIFLLSDQHTGYSDFVKLLDFGIAKDISPLGEDMEVTKTGAILGTPAYLSPEQAEADLIGPWTDIYALGLVMAEALLGEPVYKTSGLLACLEQASPDPVPLPEHLLKTPLGPIIHRATQKDASKRYRDSSTMLHELEATLSTGVTLPLGFHTGMDRANGHGDDRGTADVPPPRAPVEEGQPTAGAVVSGAAVQAAGSEPTGAKRQGGSEPTAVVHRPKRTTLTEQPSAGVESKPEQAPTSRRPSLLWWAALPAALVIFSCGVGGTLVATGMGGLLWSRGQASEGSPRAKKTSKKRAKSKATERDTAAARRKKGSQTSSKRSKKAATGDTIADWSADDVVKHFKRFGLELKLLSSQNHDSDTFRQTVSMYQVPEQADEHRWSFSWCTVMYHRSDSAQIRVSYRDMYKNQKTTAMHTEGEVSLFISCPTREASTHLLERILERS